MKYLAAALTGWFLLAGCNKEKKLMKNLEGNWRIDASEKTIYRADGSQETIEDIDDAGSLVISEGASDESKQYDFYYVGINHDTMQVMNELVTDEYNNRLIMVGGYTDSVSTRNIVWTIEKEKRNKQVWSAYGVDSTLFYPSSNNNPGAAQNWVVWKITLKREK